MKLKFLQKMMGLFAVALTTVTTSGTYAQNVSLNWAKSMGGSSDDNGQHVVVDANGNSYITGYYKGISDFDPGTGTLNLTSVFASASVYSYDIFLTKYNASGDLVWAKSMGGTSQNDQAFKMALDSSGYVYITGIFGSTGMTADFDPGSGTTLLTSKGSNDGFVAKYDTAGNFIWARGIGSASSDYAYDVALDPSGNVYVTGNFTDTLLMFDTGTVNTYNVVLPSASNTFFAKYTSAGNLVWAKAIGGAGTASGSTLVCDHFGHLYVSGSLTSTIDFDPGPGTVDLTASGGSDVFYAKYDTSGNYIWAKTVGSAGSEIPLKIKTDPGGLNIYITGTFTGTADFDPGTNVNNLTSLGNTDIFLAKYDSSGNYVWANGFGGTSLDRAFDIAIANNGQVYLTGFFRQTVDFDPGAGTAILASTTLSTADVFVAKYDASGNYLWAGQMGGTGTDLSAGIAKGAEGDLYVTGYYSGTADFDPSASTFNIGSVGGSSDVFLVKLTDGCPSFSSFSQTSCDSFSFNNNTYTVSGTYVDTFISASSCDSFVTMYLTINTSTHVTPVVIEDCDSVTFNGTSYTSTGIYTQTYTSINDCDSVLTYDITIKGQTNGSTLTQTACDSFLFNNVFYNQTGTYLATLANQNGCDSLVTLNLTIHPSPVATITQNGSLLTSSLGDSYQWIDCSNNAAITGATSRNYAVANTGSYAVIVTSNGCTDTSVCLSVQGSGTGIGTIGTDNEIRLYPNPAHGLVYLQMQRPLKNATIRLINIVGQVLQEQKDITDKQHTINLSQQAAGIYFIELIENKQTLRLKLVKE